MSESDAAQDDHEGHDHQHDHRHEDESAGLADEGHDHDHPHEPTEAELALARARVDRLSEALDAITLEDLDRYLNRAGLGVRKAVAGRLALRLDPKFLKGGIGRLVRARIRKLAPHAKLELAADLTSPLDQQTATHLGDDYESPSPAQLSALVDHLLESFPPSLVRSYLAVTAAAQAAVADELDRVLLEDPRVASPEPETEL